MTELVEVGTYSSGELGAPAALAIEDELDWEHLPFVHSTTFSAIELISAGADGWSAFVTFVDGPRMEMRVRLDADRLGYINSTWSDGVETGRTVARVDPLGPDRCRWNLWFYTPDVPGLDRAAVGAYYVDAWARIIAEDEPKMMLRAEALKAGPEGRRRRRQAVLPDGRGVSVPMLCPHMGLPLNCEPDAAGVMTCPWHGYRFDAVTGACLSGQIRGWGAKAEARSSDD